MMKSLIILVLIAITSCELESVEQSESIVPLISGGKEAVIGQFPYAVSVVSNQGNRYYYCSGTLIKHKWVLTSAGCLDTSNTNYTVFLGSIDILNGPNPWWSSPIPRTNFHYHPYYTRMQFRNNIALLYVEDMPESLLDNKNIGIVELPNENESKLNLTGMDVTISGFGDTEDMPVENFTVNLNYINTKIVPNSVCSAVPSFAVGDNNLCVDTTGGKATCAGDAGGPMTIESSSRKVLVGISSFSVSNCTKGYPVLFESINYHREWIEKTISNGSSKVKVGLLFGILGILIKFI